MAKVNRGLKAVALVLLLVIAAPISVRAASLVHDGSSSSSTAPAAIVAGALSQAVPISPQFWGLNVAPTHPFTPANAAVVAATPVSYLRYPGGKPAEELNYTSGQLTEPNGHKVNAPGNLASFVSTCKIASCHAILQLPAEINNPKLAAYYVAYVEHTLKFKPSYWEIGNEPSTWKEFSIPWSHWTNKADVAATPAEYARLVQSYTAAIRSVDSSTPIIALAGTAWSSPTAPGSWIPALMQVDGARIQDVSMHVYVAEPPPSTATLANYLAMLTASKIALPIVVPEYRSSISQGCPACHVKLVITEEGSVGADPGGWAPFALGFPGVLFVAAETAQLLQLQLANVDWFTWESGGPDAWMTTSHQLTPQYFLFSDLLAHLENETVQANLTGPPNLFASVTTNQSDVAVLVVNTDLKNSVALDLSQADLSSAGSWTQYLWKSGAAKSAQTTIVAGVKPVLPPLSVAVIVGLAAAGNASLRKGVNEVGHLLGLHPNSDSSRLTPSPPFPMLTFQARAAPADTPQARSRGESPPQILRR